MGRWGECGSFGWTAISKARSERERKACDWTRRLIVAVCSGGAGLMGGQDEFGQRYAAKSSAGESWGGRGGVSI